MWGDGDKQSLLQMDVDLLRDRMLKLQAEVYQIATAAGLKWEPKSEGKWVARETKER